MELNTRPVPGSFLIVRGGAVFKAFSFVYRGIGAGLPGIGFCRGF